MANAAKIADTAPIHMLLTGFPGTGKTGSLAALANAGYKLRVLDFDGNPRSLLTYVRREALRNIDIISLEDKLESAGNFTAPKGLPTAFNRGMSLLKRWRYKDEDGIPDEKGVKWIDLGPVADWGPDTILICDGLTGLGRAAFRKARAVHNRTPLNTSQPVWGLGIDEQLAFCEIMTAADLRCHTIMLSHLAIIGPREIAADENEVNAAIKAKAAEHVETRWYPSALGRGLPTRIAGEWPITVNLHVDDRRRRRFQFEPRKDMDLKLPVVDPSKLTELDVQTGLLKIFEALGAKSPGLKDGEAAPALAAT